MPDASPSTQMATIRFFAGPGAEVSFTTLKGDARVAAFDASGFYTTSDEDEIGALDALADSSESPVAHADEKAAPKAAAKPAPKTTSDETMSEDTDDADR